MPRPPWRSSRARTSRNRSCRPSRLEPVALHTEAAQAWRGFGHVYEHAHAHAGAGRCALALGRDGEAEADLAEARKLFEKLGARRHLVELDELLGGAAAAAS